VKSLLWVWNVEQQKQLSSFSGAGTAYPSRAPEFTPAFSGVRVTRSLVLCVCFVDRCLSYFFWPFFVCSLSSSIYGFCRGRDRMIVGFTLYVIKFVSNLRQVGRFPRVFRFPPDLHDIHLGDKSISRFVYTTSRHQKRMYFGCL